jgi:hypothetical protein
MLQWDLPPSPPGWNSDPKIGRNLGRSEEKSSTPGPRKSRGRSTAATSGRDPRVPARLFAGDQERQLERVCEPEPRELLGRRLGAHQVPALKGPAEDRVGVALRGRRRSSHGLGRAAYRHQRFKPVRSSLDGSVAAGAIRSGAERHAPEAAALHGTCPAPLSASVAFAGVARASRGRRPLVSKGAHLSRGTPLWLGWRAVSLPQALGGQSRLTNQ